LARRQPERVGNSVGEWVVERKIENDFGDH
jgi:hypothetical protein